MEWDELQGFYPKSQNLTFFGIIKRFKKAVKTIGYYFNKQILMIDKDDLIVS